MPTDAVKAAVASAVEETGYEPPPQGHLNIDPPQSEGGTGKAPPTRGTRATRADAGSPAFPSGGDEDDDRPSAEELEKIDRDPKLRQVYRGLVRRFTERTTHLADRRREVDQVLAGVEQFRADPKGTIRELAARFGLREDEPAQPSPQERARAKLADALGPEAAEVIGPAVEDAVEAVVGPARVAIAERQAEAASAALGAGIAAFGASVIEDGGEWDEDVEREMAAYVGKAQPGRGVTLEEYLGLLYDKVQSDRARASKAATPHPRPAARRAAPPAIRAGMDPMVAARQAVAEVRRQLGD
jgi:hypothetical protein